MASFTCCSTRNDPRQVPEHPGKTQEQILSERVKECYAERSELNEWGGWMYKFFVSVSS